MTEIIQKTKQDVCDNFNALHDLNAALRWEHDKSTNEGDTWLKVETETAFIFFEATKEGTLSQYFDFAIEFKNKKKDVELLKSIVSGIDAAGSAAKIKAELSDTQRICEYQKSELEAAKGKEAIISFAQETILKAIKGKSE